MGVCVSQYYDITRYYYQAYREYDEERTATPMNDGTIKYSDWKEKEGTSKENTECVRSEYRRG